MPSATYARSELRICLVEVKIRSANVKGDAKDIEAVMRSEYRSTARQGISQQPAYRLPIYQEFVHTGC